MFVVTTLPTRTGDGRRQFTFTFSSKYCLCEGDDGQKSITSIGNVLGLNLQIDKSETPHAEFILLPGTTMSGKIWFRFPIGTFDRILENVHGFKRGEDLLNLLS
jgi:hypothetical protein